MPWSTKSIKFNFDDSLDIKFMGARGIIDLISSIINGTKKVDIKKLPTQGYFYPQDFEIRLRKTKVEDIIDYEYNFKPDNVLEIIELIKKVVQKNIEFSKSYKFEDLKSVDIIFIFLELVKFTSKKPVKIHFFDESIKTMSNVEFDSLYFNYFDFNQFNTSHNSELGVIEVDDYKFSMPSIGVENCVTNFLLKKIDDVNSQFYNEQNYDFLFFVGNKNHLSDEEIENLIIIFNQDLDEQEKIKVKSIIQRFQKLIGYSLIVNNRVIDLKSNLDLANIWKE